jgi:hypothetical protein
MALNLVRNSKVFFTTNVNSSTGVINASSGTAFSATNTFEIQVLDGFTFSQNLNNETITITEAGVAPTRGQRSFNTSLAPVDFSFSTYIRPKLSSSKVICEESVLWNALLSANPIATPTSLGAVTGVTVSASGLVTIAGTSITGTLPTVASYIVLSGIATTTPTGNDKYVNSVGKVVTSTTTGITVQLINYAAVAITATTLVTSATVKYGVAAWSESTTTYSQATTGLSDKNQLQVFGMLFLVDNVLYAVDNCALNQVTVDFGIDQIATAQWTGQATVLRQFGVDVKASAGTFTGTSADVGSSGAYQVKTTDAAYITNKLSTVDLKAVKVLGSSVSAGDTYTIPLTGGSISINNNINYITPANLGIVNIPVTYYTGARAISGTMTAYLRTGTATETGELLKDMLAETANAIEPMFSLSINIGGNTASTNKVIFEMPAVSIGVPTVDVQQVVSTSIAFTAQGYVPSATTANNVFDLTNPSDLLIRYFAV